jgi:hypothetical protein
MIPFMVEYKSSGVTQKIFCKEKSIAYSVIQCWLTKYNDRKKPISASTAPAFKDVKVTQAQLERMIIINYGSRTEVRIPI